MINTKKTINISLKTSNQILDDLLLPLTQRTGFIRSKSPIIPVYFYRYIGIKKTPETYYDELYRLDKKLSSFENLYLKFTEGIPIINNTEIVAKTQNIWKNIKIFNDTKKEFLLTSLKLTKSFPELSNSLINTSIEESFQCMLELYIKNEQNINLTKIKNFSLKLLEWSHEFIPSLFKNVNFRDSTLTEIFNPKVIYYGNIKKHEAYFLIFLSKLGCDILFINSYEDEAFLTIDKAERYSKLFQLSQKAPLKEFPQQEILQRRETVAFQASSEIANVIYNDEDGLYKPWQFESYKTQPLTLKTTYDELKILWTEEARMRTGFKIENNTVYIPNLFAKISGVHHDLNKYWQEFIAFKSSENMLFIPELPFIKVDFSSYELNKANALLGQHELLDKERLLNSPLYKFSYLKTALQETIFCKINYLMKLSIFKKPVDSVFKQKILMTLLTMDKQFLNLIQTFDYPFQIPKIVIYDNSENIFSDEGAILLAFLYLMGLDILLFTPTGYNNIEQIIHEKYYDIHKLEDVKFDLPLPDFKHSHKNNKEKSKSFFTNFFKL